MDVFHFVCIVNVLCMCVDSFGSFFSTTTPRVPQPLQCDGCIGGRWSRVGAPLREEEEEEEEEKDDDDAEDLADASYYHERCP